jgi:lysine 2,3-aminomutase
VEENLTWTSEVTRAYRNVRELYNFLEWDLSPEIEEVAKLYPIFITRSLAHKLKKAGPQGILAKEFLPIKGELADIGMIDPIGDKIHLKAPQLIHRYDSRALFTPTTTCPVHCRYCFRKNELSVNDELFMSNFEKTLSYLRDHKEISEIIFTGGDPLTLSNSKIEKYLMSFSELSHIKDIRFHSRYPVILPERIDDEFLLLLKKFSQHYRTISIAIHANHAQEFDNFSKRKISELSQLKVQLLSQTVLLKDINDRSEDLVDLIETFISLGIKPYYLHHPDQVRGGMHFYLPLQRGREIYRTLRQKLPGWAIPQYIVDIPGGHGKVPAYNPETSHFSGQFVGKSGEIISGQEPDLFV